MENKLVNLIINAVNEDAVILLNYILRDFIEIDEVAIRELLDYSIKNEKVNASTYLNNYLKEITLNLTK